MISSTSISYGKVWTVINLAYTFSQDPLTIDIGDSVRFTLASIHNAVEVSQTSWHANSATALPCGFITPLGGGLVPASHLALGTHRYVCNVHVATMGMKGIIIVQSPTVMILDQQTDKNISFYPNPASSVIHLILSEPQAMFMIMNLAGQEIMNKNIEYGDNPIDMEMLSEGACFMVVISDKKRIYSGKLIIE